MLRCGVCRRETSSHWGFCYRPGPCNAARQRAIRLDQRRQVAELRARLTEIESIRRYL
jgi:hypothetical protein